MNAKQFLLVCFYFFLYLTANAQDASIPPPAKAKVGIFIPLHLDSVFTAGGNYKFSGTIPKYVLPGLEFYSGVQLALDSLQKEGLNAEVFIIDSKDRDESISRHIENDLKDAGLLIGMVQNVAELKTLSDAAYSHSIPFISATYPNDGGIVGNPSLVILNATLRSHCQGIYKLLANSYRSSNIIFLTKTGTQEDKIKSVLVECNSKSTSPLTWRMADIGDGISKEELQGWMDSTKNNVLVCGTLDERGRHHRHQTTILFATQLSK